MRPKSWGVLSFIVCAALAVSMAASAAAQNEVFVVAASINADATYMTSNLDGSLSPQYILQLTRDSVIPVPKTSYGNGLGDFDGDGDLDYIMGIGYSAGNIYISENLGSGYEFEPPVFAGSWSVSGAFPADMAVADFNEDGNTDFVMVLLGSSSTMFYEGNGEMGFEASVLSGRSPVMSYGVDAADFNNDGHADFVVAPASTEQIYVNLGDGTGSFDTYTFYTYNSTPVYGVAAADFTGDGIVDIATAFIDSLIIYKGAGDGKTFEFFDDYFFDLNLSALDNCDLNNDTKQDLVAANYDGVPGGVVALVNDGSGTFTLTGDIAKGGSPSTRWAVSAPPYESNKAPVAVIEPAYLEVMAGEEVLFNGYNSYDDDGSIVSYEWDFDDNSSPEAAQNKPDGQDNKLNDDGATPSHIYYNAGNYMVTLTVKDDKGAVASVQAEVKVTPVLVTVKFSPDSLNLNSREKWVVATVKLPDGFDTAKIDPSKVILATKTSDPVSAYHEHKHGFLSKLWRRVQHRMKVFTVKFKLDDLRDAIDEPSDNLELSVQGKLSINGVWVDFTGSGTIRTFENHKPWKSGFYKKHQADSSHKKTKSSAKGS